MRPTARFNLITFLLFICSLTFGQIKSTKENHAPVFVKEMPDTTILPGKTLIYQYKAVDPDGDSITYSAKSALPINAVFIPATGYLSWRPANSQHGKLEIIIEATDGKLSVSSRKSTITVLDAGEDFGGIINYSCIPAEGGKIITSITNDVVTAIAKPNKGFVIKNWTNNGNVVSTDSTYIFRYPAVTYTYNIAANFRINHAPVFVKEMPDTTIMATTKYFFKYEAADPDGDSLKFYASTQLPNSSALLENGQFAWLPSNNDFIHANKSEVIVYVTDGNLKSFSRKTTLRIREVSSIEERYEMPKEFFLSQNYPNPFNPETTIEYSIPVKTRHGESLQHVSLKVYDVLGREVATLVDEYKQAGNYKATFNIETRHGVSLPSGVYFYQLRTGSYVETKKFVLLK